MQTSSVKMGSRVMYAMGTYALVMSLFWVFLTELIFVNDFLGCTGATLFVIGIALPSKTILGKKPT